MRSAKRHCRNRHCGPPTFSVTCTVLGRLNGLPDLASGDRVVGGDGEDARFGGDRIGPIVAVGSCRGSRMAAWSVAQGVLDLAEVLRGARGDLRDRRRSPGCYQCWWHARMSNVLIRDVPGMILIRSGRRQPTGARRRRTTCVMSSLPRLPICVGTKHSPGRPSAWAVGPRCRPMSGRRYSMPSPRAQWAGWPADRPAVEVMSGLNTAANRPIILSGLPISRRPCRTWSRSRS